MFRLLPLLVFCVGVVASWRLGHHDDAFQQRPIITTAQKQRICADLCSSGLGGEPCGDVCFDLMPRGIPLQSLPSSNNTYALDVDDVDVKTVNTRSDVCPVLCKHRLGYPLCQCKPMASPLTKKQAKTFRVDFNVICEHYCEHQYWALRGCPVCSKAAVRQDGLQALFKQDGDAVMLPKMASIDSPETSFHASTNRQVDWAKWCTTQCANSNGGSACNCDILPFSL